MTWNRRTRLWISGGVVYAVLAIAASCGRDRSTAREWVGSIDTVGGRVIVHNPPEGVWGPENRGRLIETLRIGSVAGGGPDMFGSIRGIAVSERGEIAVLDEQAQDIRIFDPSGRHLRTVGRKGAGPGEFEGAVAIHYDALDRLWVVDVRNGRYEVFSPTGEYIRSTPRRAGVTYGDPGAFTQVGLLDPTPYFAPTGDMYRLYVVIDTAGAVVDTLPWIYTGDRNRLAGVPAAVAPYLPTTTSAAEPGGDVWLASTDKYTLFRRTALGDTVLVAELQVATPHLSADDRAAIDSIMARWTVPVNWSALGLGPQIVRSLHPDDQGNLFVRSNLARERAAYQFEMFDPQGRFLGVLEADVAFDRTAKVVFRGNAAYGVTRDSLDVPYVVRAAVQIPSDAR